MFVAVGWFCHLVGSRLRGVQVLHLALLTSEVERPPCYYWSGVEVATEFTWSPWTLQWGKSLGFPLCLFWHLPVKIEKGLFVTARWGSSPVCHCSPLTPQEQGAHYHLAEGEVLVSYLDLSDITLIGALGQLITVSWGWKSQLTISLCWYGWRWSNSFFCPLVGVWLLTKGFLSC